jgi:hypothetical protein
MYNRLSWAEMYVLLESEETEVDALLLETGARHSQFLDAQRSMAILLNELQLVQWQYYCALENGYSRRRSECGILPQWFMVRYAAIEYVLGAIREEQDYSKSFS